VTIDADRAALLRRTYDAFNRRDIDAVLATLAADVDWPDMIHGRRVRGHDEVRAYWEAQFAEIDPHVEPTGVSGGGDRAVVTVHQVVRDRQGAVLSDTHVHHVYAFRDDLVVRMDVEPVER
jgi:ketosteroid isomerase-like protein